MNKSSYHLVKHTSKLFFILSIFFTIISCLPIRNISTINIESHRTFTKALLYRGLFLHKKGTYSQDMLGLNWNIITAISRSIAKNLTKAELFEKILYETIPEEPELRKYTGLLEMSAKTTHVTFEQIIKTSIIEIKLDIIIKPAFIPDGDPVFFRSYHINDISNKLVHPIRFAYQVINRLVERILTDIAAGDFDNLGYKSLITETIGL